MINFGVAGSSVGITNCFVTADPQGSIYLSGFAKGIFDLDPGPGIVNFNPLGANDVFIVKLDSSGNYIWSGQTEGAYDVRIQSLTSDIDGNVYLAGQFLSYVDFDITASGIFQISSVIFDDWDTFVVKVDSSGNFKWANSIYGTSQILFPKIAVDSSGRVFTTGTHLGTVDVDPSLNVHNLNGYGGYVQAVDSNGLFLWAVQLEGSVNCEAIDVDDNLNLYTAGYFNSIVDFDPGSAVHQENAPSTDTYVLKLSECGITDLNVDSILCYSEFVSPGSGAIYTSSGIYFDTIVNEAGCDLVYTLDLTFNSLGDTQSIVTCVPFPDPDGIGVYDSSGTYVDTLSSVAGCDSVITTILTYNPSYAFTNCYGLC